VKVGCFALRLFFATVPHPLKGSRKNTWSITINGNWRLTFTFQDGDVFILNYEDYH
jgi:proteic killer suppression protein